MKRLFLTLTAGAMIFASCESAPEADKAEAGEAQEVTATEGTQYEVNKAESKLEWVGTKPVGKHHGTIQLQEGTLMANETGITGGKFVFDVTTLQPDDQDEKGNNKLRTHLLSEDFFHAEQYPAATFEVTSVSQGAPQGEDVIMKDATHTVTGNLTLKDVTKSITFPAKVNMEGDKIVADANFNIDRTQWNMNYGNDKSLGDSFIYPEVNLQLHIVANK